MFARAREVAPNEAADRLRWIPAPASDRLERRWDDIHPVLPDTRKDGRHGVVAGATGRFGLLRLIADLAARLATTETSAIDDAIVDSLRQIGQALDLDRIALWRKVEGASFVVTLHHWASSPQPPGSESLNLTCLPFVAARVSRGEVASFRRIEEVADPVDREALLVHGFRSAAVVPLASTGGGNGVDGVLTFSFTTSEHDWPTATIELLRLATGVIAQTLARQASATVLQRALDDLDRLRKQMTQAEHDVESRPEVAVVPGPRRGDGLQTENVHLRCEVQAPCGSGIIIGQTPSVRRVLEQLQQVAATDATVLLLGETGTGKELLATHLHELSARRGHAMVRVNCSAIPATLMESELFGREKGAFTGALARQIGRFELADRSTIFLDEIGDVPADVQVKLLRVLEERQIERLGSPKGIHVDVRIVAATHRNLEQRITEGTFREDLFYRLNVFPIQVPALRDRADDIPLLVWRFVDEFSKTFGKRIDAISRENMSALQQYSWPGNIRELRNVVERAMIVATGTQLTIALPATASFAGHRSLALTDVEKEHIRSVLESSGWRIRGSGGAAERLGLRPTTLETRMAKLGLSRPKRV
jgi:formate hydrogenlyase transcriptional activator